MKKRNKIMLICLLTLLYLTGFSEAGTAAGGNNCIRLLYSVNNHTQGIEGGGFTAVKIAEYRNGMAAWALAARMIPEELTLQKVTDDPEMAARLLAEQKISASLKKYTDSEGSLIFSGLDDGIWLICQESRRKMAGAYELAAPSLVTVPAWKDDRLTEEVIIYPKTTVLVKETEETDTSSPAKEDKKHRAVQTGDETPIRYYVVCILIAGVLIPAAEKRRRQTV